MNGTQIRVDDDGRFRIVIAHEDPGCPNWLDAAGCEHGMIQYRYVWTEDAPAPSIERLAFDEVWSRLPAATPRVTEEERHAQIAARQAAIRRRLRY
jgi:hypothetical protein